MVASIVQPLGEARARSEDGVFETAASFGVEEVHLFAEPEIGLKGIVAIHSTALGPALGGTRYARYPSFDAALADALGLARGMSYKAAIHGLPLGGGKAVLIAPPELSDREAYFEAWGKWVDTLRGRFITAEDSGTSVADMDAVARRTRYVAGTSALGDPAPFTARGVRRALEAALAFRYDKNSVAGMHVAIQGVGHVGYALAGQLSERGARITVADVDSGRAARCVRDFNAEVVAPDAIYDVEADVFAPCALGGTINPQTLGRLEVAIIAGSANNQLQHDGCARLAYGKGILYVPDYVANGGGLMMAAGLAPAELPGRVDGIYDLTLYLLGVADETGTPPLTVANRNAEVVLNGTKR